jgi:AraC-like DNA-binding protein
MDKITFPSVELHLNGLQGFDMHAMQLSSGRFLCQQRDLRLPNVILGDRFINTAVQYQSVLKQDWFYILIPKDKVQMSVNGQKISMNQSVVFTKDQEVLVQIPESYYAYYIIITVEELTKYFDRDYLEQLKRIISQQNFATQIFSRAEHEQSHLCSSIASLLNNSESLSFQSVLYSQQIIIESVCKMLTLSSLFPDIYNSKISTRLTTVNRALKYIHKSSFLDITISELAEASFCCVRSLEYAFSSILDITPKQYLIKKRFQLIHLTLKDKSKTSVNEIINNFGIINQGRFAQDYYKFYDEYPHQTNNKIFEL